MTTLSNKSEQSIASNATPPIVAELVRQVHYILQGEDGVDKSLIASVIVQYIRGKDRPLVVYGTDPMNTTLAGYKTLGTQRLELMREGSLVERSFDRLIEQIVEDDSGFVVDSDAASFIPLSYYLAKNDAINPITENSKQVYIRTVITGGQTLRGTPGGFASLCEQMPGDVHLVVWLNELFGDIETEGRTFGEMKVYQFNKDCVHGIVRTARQTSSTYGEDMKLMLGSKLTLDEIKRSLDFDLISESRLNKVKSSLFEQLDTII